MISDKKENSTILINNKESEHLNDLHNLEEIIGALPYIAAILSSDRKILFSNHKILKSLNVHTFEELFEKKLGEPINCIYINAEPEICNTLEQCKFCKIINAISKCKQYNGLVEEKCKISYEKDHKEFEVFFNISAAPIYIHKDQYIILALNNVSLEKRKEDLEKIFFHDIINSAGNLFGVIDLMKDMDDDEKLKDFIDLAYTASKELIDEIVAQKQLLAAENNVLEVENVTVITNVLLNEVITNISQHPVSKNRILKISDESSHVAFPCDIKILKRVLINMLKNAVEATAEWGEIEIGSNYNNGVVDIWVKNNSFIPLEIQQQIFSRPISTKGKNRGLGTYSMKLLTEQYLKGKISFETCEVNGTKFNIKLPAYTK
jgi:K+-sensing histidine kinase KdpD